MKKIIISSVVAVIIAASVGAWFFFKPSETDLMFEKCKEKVLSQLKAPSTAVFGEYVHTKRHQEKFKYSEGGIDQEAFTFSLDAQNPFGAMIRSDWKCEINYEKDQVSWINTEVISK